LREEVEVGKWGERVSVRWIGGAPPELVLLDADDKEVRGQATRCCRPP
jgi:hypothetical protein